MFKRVLIGGEKQTWRVITAVDGIEDIARPTFVTPEVELFQLDDSTRAAFLDDIIERDRQSYVHFGRDLATLRSRQERQKEFEKYLRSPLAATTVADCTDDEATTIGGERIRAVLHSINLLTAYSINKQHRIRIGIRGELFTSKMIPEFVLLSTNSPDTSRIATYYVKPAHLTMPVEFIDRFPYDEVNALGTLLLRHRRNELPKNKEDMSRRLSIAIEWFVQGTQAQRTSLQALSYFTVLELLLKTTTDISITAEISEGCALLLEDELGPRQELSRSIKKLYHKRSQLVHHGLELFEDDDVLSLEHIASRLIVTIFYELHQVPDSKKLRAVIDTLKFS